jgi:hypothetical protein
LPPTGKGIGKREEYFPGRVKILPFLGKLKKRGMDQQVISQKRGGLGEGVRGGG